jgi:putative DNA primase/helicase
LESIISRLQADGYRISDFVPDGKFHRFQLDQNDHRKSGFYVAYRNFVQTTGEEYYFVVYGSWRDGLDNAKRLSTLTGGLSPAETKTQQDQIRKMQREAEKLRESEHDHAAFEAQKKWNTLSVNGESDYLKRKQIAGAELGIRYDNFYGDIYVPVRDEKGKLWSLETIKYDGAKLSHPGGRKQACFHLIGSELGPRIFIAEGFATASSIHLATSETVVCTFGSAGLKRVAATLRKNYPERELIICGDLDRPNTDSSRIAAQQAGEIAACNIVFPTFTTGHGKDFNDLHCTEGLDAVKAQLSTELQEIKEFSPTQGIYPDENERGKRLSTLRNVKELIRRLNITVRYDVISKSVKISIPNLTTSIDNEIIVKHTFISDWCKRVQIPTESLNSQIPALADQNLYNPVASWIESEAWDGVSRLPEFYETIQSNEKTLKEILIRKWLLSAVAGLYEEHGVYAGGVLVLQGQQYTGKTAWFKSLVPKSTGLEVLAEGVTLRPDDKDSVYHAISHWLVELGELDATFRKADIAQLKSFLTKTKDTIRLPYAERESNFVRRTVFFASVNETNFLNDPTGSRRFWTLPCEGINYNHGINMQQLWAEVAEMYRGGDTWILTKEEDAMLNEHNIQFQGIDPIEERIRDYYAWEAPKDRVIIDRQNATAVCISIGILNPSRADVRAATQAIHRISKQKPQRMREFNMPRLRNA